MGFALTGSSGADSRQVDMRVGSSGRPGLDAPLGAGTVTDGLLSRVWKGISGESMGREEEAAWNRALRNRRCLDRQT